MIINKLMISLIVFAFTGVFVSLATPIELTDPPECPQSREKTLKAPDEIYNKVNPLKRDNKNYKKGKLLYMVKAKTLQCKHCHGIQGDGKGGMAPESFPNPRNFTCAETMNQISDGQMFWAISHGIPKTSMPSYKEFLSEEQVWQLVLFVREYSRKKKKAPASTKSHKAFTYDAVGEWIREMLRESYHK
jgi:cytochrome c